MDNILVTTDPKIRFPFGVVTTAIFLLVLFLLPILLLFRLFEAVTVGGVGAFFTQVSGATTPFQDYLSLIVPVTVLAVWSFLRKPEVLIRSRRMEPLTLHNPELGSQILGWVNSAHLKTPTLILRIPDDKPDVFAFGTWQYQYLAIADGAKECWSNPDQLKAVLLHEIGHLKAGDTWKAALSLEYVQWYFVMIFWQFVIGQVEPGLFGPNPFVFAGLLWAVIIALAQMVTGLLFVFAIRFLFRLREFGADLFSATQGGNKNALTDAFYTYLGFGGMPTKSQELSFMSEGVKSRLTKLLGFHPSTLRRLIIIGEPRRLIEEVIGIEAVAGLVVGVVVTWFWSGTTLPILVSGMLIVGIPFILFLKPGIFGDKIISGLANFRYIIKTAMIFSTGVVVAWLFYIVPPSLLELDVNDTGSHFITGGELRFNLSYSLDVLLLIAVAMPFIITGFVYLASLLSKTLVKNLTYQSKDRLVDFWGWFWELPFIAIICWISARWWDGYIISFNEIELPLALSAFWILMWAGIDQIAKSRFNATRLNR